MASDNIYNQPGAQKIYLTLANQTDEVLTDDMGKCKIAVSTDEKLLNYTDDVGTKHKCAEYGSSGTSIDIFAPASWPAAVADHPILFLDSGSGNLMIRMPTNSPFGGVAREINASDPL
jgi:hypothetical protein